MEGPTLTETYLAMLHGLLAMRSVADLSQSAEAEIAAIHEQVRNRLTDQERAQLDPEMIERAKQRWRQA